METIVQRDVGDLARILALDATRRRLVLPAGHTAGLNNVSDLATPFQVSRPIPREHITLLERGAPEAAGIEVKACATASDFRGLRTRREAAGDRSRAGVVLCDGETALPFGRRLRAVPLRLLSGAVWTNET